MHEATFTSPLAPDEVEQIATFIRAHGEQHAAKACNTTPLAVCRAALGLPLRPTTRHWIRIYLRKTSEVAA